MAGKRPYKTWPLAELEELEQTRLAVGQRIPAALKEAIAAKREEAGRTAVEVDGVTVASAKHIDLTDGADHAGEHASQMVADQDDDSGYSEACELEHDELVARAAAMDAEQAAETEAEIKARRKEFGKRVNKLRDGGFSVDQAVEALAAEMPVEAAQYRAGLIGADPAQPPERRLEDIDL